MEWGLLATAPLAILIITVLANHSYSISIRNLPDVACRHRYGHWALASLGTFGLLTLVLYLLQCFHFTLPEQVGLLIGLSAVPTSLGVLCLGLFQPFWKASDACMRHLPLLIVACVILGIASSPFFWLLFIYPLPFGLCYITVFVLLFLDKKNHGRVEVRGE